MYNKINFEILVQILIELFISAIMITTLINGNINLLVHPKFNLMLWITSIVLILMAFVSLFQLFRPKHMNVLSKYFLVIIPLIITFYISKDSIYNLGASGASSEYNFENVNIPEVNEYKEREKYVKKPGKDYIEIDDNQYLKWYYESTLSWSNYKGTRFKILATVFKDNSQKEEFVVLGRMGMICCMADIQPCGFIYNEKGYNNLKSGEWYWVEGEIRDNEKYTYNYEQLPMIFNVKLEEARKPIDKFVYIQ